jgi:pimeloyl-ACP methyl ester carboxylesterase
VQNITPWTGIRVREYGDAGPLVVVLHGGPGVAGYMAPVARGLADAFRVLEPLQRRSGAEPLTVAGHIADLHELLEARCGDGRPALVGHSWGAMLALAYAAAHPGRAVALALIGNGTFDLVARDRLHVVVEQRMDDGLRRRLTELPQEVPDPDERLDVMGQLILPLYSCDLLPADQEAVTYDARGHHETWQDMVRLQGEGTYPAAFAAIKVPVIMLHGAVDPHPGQMIRDGLLPYLPQLEYREWRRCGHYPWREKGVRDEFFSALRHWLARQFT